MTTRRKKKRTAPLTDEPQLYVHRVEMAIEALNHALAGANKIVSFLLAQQGPGWPNYELLDEAAGEFHKATWRIQRAKAYRRKPARSQQQRQKGKRR